VSDSLALEHFHIPAERLEVPFLVICTPYILYQG
jgi:hypothetical protein